MSRLALWCCLSLLMAGSAWAAETTHYEPSRYGAGLLLGQVYDPQEIGLAILQGVLLVDYDRIFPHRAPASLRLKLEGNLGLTTDGRNRLLISVDMLALNYLSRFAVADGTPYVEAGIGLIYTDFRVEGQGLRFNFNPQAGVGLEYALPKGGALTTALRFHHVSNGNLFHENRGMNSALLMIGYLF